MISTLITGINGFLGKHLTQFLKQSGYHIIGIDIQENAKYEVDEYYQHDITKNRGLLNIGTTTDYIIHLASVTGLNIDKKIMYNVNVEGTANICDLGKKLNVKKIIYLSSVSVYSNFNEKTITEDSEVNPVNYYGETKLAAEKVIKDSGLNFTILRPTNIFGEGREEYKNYFINIKKRGRRLGIIFYYRRITHLIYVKDIVEVIGCCLKNEDTVNKTYIVADNEQNYTEKNVFKILLAYFNLNKRLLPYPLFWKKKDTRIFNSSRLKEICNIKYGVEQGIINYLKKN